MLSSRWSVIRALLVGSLIAASSAGAQLAPRAQAVNKPANIEDNSFLIEEAYNQERGVVQHISTFTRFNESESWIYSFTQEWPFFSQKHQLSFTLPVLSARTLLGENTGLGDVALNYRHQLLNSELVAFAPRVSVLLPTGDETRARGAGTMGLQVNLPVSTLLAERLVAHSNAGVTYTPSSRNELRHEATTNSYNLGQSLIWLVRPTLNVMLELAWSSEEEVTGPGETSRANSLLLAPGVRGAINFPSGLQIVPGVAVPIGLGPSSGETAVFLYLSFEHPFSRESR